MRAHSSQPANGSLWIGDGHVEDLNTNIGGLQTSGVDLNLNYTGFEMGSRGSLSLNLTGTYLIEIVTDPVRRAPCRSIARVSSRDAASAA